MEPERKQRRWKVTSNKNHKNNILHSAWQYWEMILLTMLIIEVVLPWSIWSGMRETTPKNKCLAHAFICSGTAGTSSDAVQTLGGFLVSQEKKEKTYDKCYCTEDTHSGCMLCWQLLPVLTYFRNYFFYRNLGTVRLKGLESVHPAPMMSSADGKSSSLAM